MNEDNATKQAWTKWFQWVVAEERESFSSAFWFLFISLYWIFYVYFLPKQTYSRVMSLIVLIISNNLPVNIFIRPERDLQVSRCFRSAVAEMREYSSFWHG